MDWSGSLTASNGRLTLVKTIAFETDGVNLDSVMLPQSDPKVITFTSHTKERFDGLLVRYQRCITGTTASSTDARLTFRAPNLSPAFSRTWNVSDLEKLHETYKDLNVNHDSFQIQSLRRFDNCEHGKGTIHGMWFKTNDRFGQIKGRVVSSEGMPVGHIKGFYSAADPVTGEHKVVAKLIGIHGGFLGILNGTGKDGVFTADILGRDRVKIGTVTGRYEEGGGERRHRGVFFATYELRALCLVREPAPVTP
jgi:hypothetical protein